MRQAKSAVTPFCPREKPKDCKVTAVPALQKPAKNGAKKPAQSFMDDPLIREAIRLSEHHDYQPGEDDDEGFDL
jgi:hypothetical protein